MHQRAPHAERRVSTTSCIMHQPREPQTKISLARTNPGFVTGLGVFSGKQTHFRLRYQPLLRGLRNNIGGCKLRDEHGECRLFANGHTSMLSCPHVYVPPHTFMLSDAHSCERLQRLLYRRAVFCGQLAPNVFAWMFGDVWGLLRALHVLNLPRFRV